ncbi:MAG: flagellar brake protein [Myxococcota bacterium]
MSRILGNCRFVRIICLGDTLVDMTPGMTVNHESGVAVVLPGEPGSSVPSGTIVTVEIGQIEGIYQYDSKVTRSIPTPLEGVIPNPLGTHLLITRFPGELRLYNQRDSYRVGLEIDVEATVLAEMADGGSWMATGEKFPCHVLDLSIGGCGLETKYELNEGDRVSLNVPLLDEWVDIRATTVRIGGEDPSTQTYRFGLEFRELTMAQEDILHKAVMTMQRTALADDEDSEGTEDESEGEGETEAKNEG